MNLNSHPSKGFGAKHPSQDPASIRKVDACDAHAHLGIYHRWQAAPERCRVSPSRPALSSERVLKAALDLVDADGLDALTMRRLGHRLGRDPMAIYRYLPNRSVLLDGIVELVLSQLTIPSGGPDSQDWQEQLRRTAHDFRTLALAHPHVIPLLITRPRSTPLGLRPQGTLRPLEQFLQMLTRAGFSPADTLHIYRLYFDFLHGHICSERLEQVEDQQEAQNLLRLVLHRLARKEFPAVRRLGAALTKYDGAAELDQGLDILLAGLRAHFHITKQRGTTHSITPTKGPPVQHHQNSTQ